MTPPRPSESARSVKKRAQIIEAAVVEFQDKGFALASMEAVAARAAVSKRTLYKHFDSKDLLFRAIVTELSGQITDRLDLRYDPGRAIRDQLTDLARAKVRLFGSADVMAMSRMLLAETLRCPELAAEVQDRIDKTRAIAGMLQAASADGQLVIEDCEAAAEEFLGLIKARAFWPVIFGAPELSQERQARIVTSSVEMMMCRYGPRA